RCTWVLGLDAATDPPASGAADGRGRIAVGTKEILATTRTTTEPYDADRSVLEQPRVSRTQLGARHPRRSSLDGPNVLGLWAPGSRRTRRAGSLPGCGTRRRRSPRSGRRRRLRRHPG